MFETIDLDLTFDHEEMQEAASCLPSSDKTMVNVVETVEI